MIVTKPPPRVQNALFTWSRRSPATAGWSRATRSTSTSDVVLEPDPAALALIGPGRPTAL